MLAASMLSQHNLQIFTIPYFLKPLLRFESDLHGLKAMHPGAPHLIPLGLSASNGDVGSLPTSGTEGRPGGLLVMFSVNVGCRYDGHLSPVKVAQQSLA